MLLFDNDLLLFEELFIEQVLRTLFKGDRSVDDDDDDEDWLLLNFIFLFFLFWLLR